MLVNVGGRKNLVYMLDTSDWKVRAVPADDPVCGQLVPYDDAKDELAKIDNKCRVTSTVMEIGVNRAFHCALYFSWVYRREEGEAPSVMVRADIPASSNVVKATGDLTIATMFRHLLGTEVDNMSTKFVLFRYIPMPMLSQYYDFEVGALLPDIIYELDAIFKSADGDHLVHLRDLGKLLDVSSLGVDYSPKETFEHWVESGMMPLF